MNFAFTEEQEQLRQFVRSFLEEKSPEAAVREQMETDDGYDAAVWSQMAEQLGLQSLVIPEEHGGQGFSFVELGVVLEEMGRALLCAPFLSSVLESGITMEAAASGDGHTLSGVKSFVIDGHTANLIIVAAKTGAGVSLFAVDGDAAGLTREALSTMDQTRKQAKLTFDNTPATLIGTDGGGWATMSTVLDLGAIALAAEQVGGAQYVLEMAVQYAKDRVQFGRPIGSFQAIKHKCADMLLEVESAKSAAYYGLWCAAEMNDELPSVASLAKSYCSEAYFHAAAENIQIHGGIGFTWEHPAQIVLDVHEAIEFCAEALPQEVTATLSYDQLRRMLRLHLEWIQAYHWAPETEGPAPIVFEQFDALDYVMERVAVTDVEISRDHAAAIIQAHSDYLQVMGAIHLDDPVKVEQDLAELPLLDNPAATELTSGDTADADQPDDTAG